MNIGESKLSYGSARVRFTNDFSFESELSRRCRCEAEVQNSLAAVLHPLHEKRGFELELSRCCRCEAEDQNSLAAVPLPLHEKLGFELELSCRCPAKEDNSNSFCRPTA